jgi:hypothetical protein
MELAATKKISNKKGIWFVPSQSGNGEVYQVNVMPQVPSCTCPDHETRGVKCKHIFAVKFVLKREYNDDGSTTVTKQVTVTETKHTYPQNWSAYNEAQTHEQDKFQILLAELCAGLFTPLPRLADRACRCPIPFSASCSKFIPPSRNAAS